MAGPADPELHGHHDLGKSRISERTLSEGPVLIVCQKPETLNKTNDSLQ